MEPSLVGPIVPEFRVGMGVAVVVAVADAMVVNLHAKMR